MRALLLLVPLVAGCHYATAPDPCPTPVEAHPEAWKQTPIMDAAGNVVMFAYVCVSQ